MASPKRVAKVKARILSGGALQRRKSVMKPEAQRYFARGNRHGIYKIAAEKVEHSSADMPVVQNVESDRSVDTDSAADRPFCSLALRLAIPQDQISIQSGTESV